MPLSAPPERVPVHTRRVTCRGFHRADGLWDIEGSIVDTKAYEFDMPGRRPVEPGEPVHDMQIRLTLDDRLTIRAAEATTLASPFAVCPGATAVFANLVGLRVKPGWMKEVKARIGGAHGCTHITELLGPVATTAFQTVFPYREHLRSRDPNPDARPVPPAAPPIGSCIGYAAENVAAREAEAAS